MKRAMHTLVHGEKGVSAVIAAIVLVAIFGAATLSVDAGNAWQSRRNLVTATDAAALAEAREIAIGSSSGSCTGIYDSVLSNNAGNDVYERVCTVHLYDGANTGYVTVESRKPIDVRFGAVLGLDDTNAYSMSAAMVGYPTGARGIRPIGFCNQNAHVQEWRELRQRTPVGTDETYDALKGAGDTDGDGLIDHPDAGPQNSYDDFGVIHRMYFTRSVDDGACGTFPGNWGWLNFDGGAGGNGTPEIREWLRYGYDGMVSVRSDLLDPCAGEPGQGDADDSEEGCVPASPGELGNSVQTALESIKDKEISVLVMDSGDCVGGGSTCRFESWGFLGLIVRGWKLNGAGVEYFDFEFTNLQTSGFCCDAAPATEDLGVRSIALCAVDHDSVAIDSATRCGRVAS